jgi:hypothetical protein
MSGGGGASDDGCGRRLQSLKPRRRRFARHRLRQFREVPIVHLRQNHKHHRAGNRCDHDARNRHSGHCIAWPRQHRCQQSWRSVANDGARRRPVAMARTLRRAVPGRAVEGRLQPFDLGFQCRRCGGRCAAAALVAGRMAGRIRREKTGHRRQSSGHAHDGDLVAGAVRRAGRLSAAVPWTRRAGNRHIRIRCARMCRRTGHSREPSCRGRPIPTGTASPQLGA